MASEALARWAARTEASLERLLPDPAIEPVGLHAAMRHATLGGGKRMRPLLVYAAGAAFVYANSRRNIPRALRPLSLAYMLMLCVLSVSLILPLLTAFWWGKLVAFFGATFFLASDGVLCDMLFVKKAEPTKQNFVVMLTYILAQVLLAVGFAACP